MDERAVAAAFTISVEPAVLRFVLLKVAAVNPRVPGTFVPFAELYVRNAPARAFPLLSPS